MSLAHDLRNFRPEEDGDKLALFRAAGFETTALGHDVVLGSYGTLLTLAVSGFGPVIPLVGATIVAGVVGAGHYTGELGCKAQEKLKAEISSVIEQYPEEFSRKELEDLATAISRTYVTPYYPIKATVFRKRLEAFRASVIDYVEDKRLPHAKRTHPFPEPFILSRYDNIAHHGNKIQKAMRPFAFGNFLDSIGKKKPTP